MFALAFPLIGNWIAWSIGNGQKVKLGLYSSVGSSDAYKLSNGILDLLKEPTQQRLHYKIGYETHISSLFTSVGNIFGNSMLL